MGKKRITIKSIAMTGKSSPTAPANALADNQGTYIITPNNEFIIVNKE
jgi:hypothetical protein